MWKDAKNQDVAKMVVFKSYDNVGKICARYLILFVMLAAIAGIYLGNYYHADLDSVEAFSMEESADGHLVWELDNAAAGLIFYPGGKVEHKAYIPLMESLAEKGMLCVLVEMPFRLAVFDMDAAEGIQEQYPEIENWYIGGHSLGGAMAAAYLSENVDDYEGLILLGSYSTANLSETDLAVLSVYGSEDGVLNREKYEECKVNLPVDFAEVVIDGGCHDYFGMYGVQKGDGTPGIGNEEQIEMTAEAVLELVENN